MQILQGDLVIASSGLYSNYCIEGCFRANKDFTKEEIIAAYSVNNPKEVIESKWHNLNVPVWKEFKLFSFLVENKYLTPEKWVDLRVYDMYRAKDDDIGILAGDNTVYH